MHSSQYRFILFAFIVGFTSLLLAQNSTQEKVLSKPGSEVVVGPPHIIDPVPLDPTKPMVLKETKTDKMFKTAVSAADADLEMKLTETILALGWEKELLATDLDLVVFERQNPKFAFLFTSIALLTLSEKLDRYHDIGKLASANKGGVLSFFTAESIAQLITMLKPIGLSYILYMAAPGFLKLTRNPSNIPVFGLMVGLMTIGILRGIGTYATMIPSGASKALWGTQISFKERLAQADLSNTSAYVSCRDVKNKKSYLLNDEGGNLLLHGSWGQDLEDKLSGFATQEDALELFNRCARHLRKTLKVDKLDPNDILPMANSAQHSKVHSLSYDYPIFYYSKYVDDDGNAVKLKEFFKSK